MLPVPYGPSSPWNESVTADTKRALVSYLGKALERGELGAVAPMQQLPDGRWAVRVWRIREERPAAPAWRKPVLVAGGVLVALSVAGGLGWWLVSATAAALGTVSLPLVLGGGAVLLAGRLILRSAGSGCETTVTIKHRH